MSDQPSQNPRTDPPHEKATGDGSSNPRLMVSEGESGLSYLGSDFNELPLEESVRRSFCLSLVSEIICKNHFNILETGRTLLKNPLQVLQGMNADICRVLNGPTLNEVDIGAILVRRCLTYSVLFVLMLGVTRPYSDLNNYVWRKSYDGEVQRIEAEHEKWKQAYEAVLRGTPPADDQTPDS